MNMSIITQLQPISMTSHPASGSGAELVRLAQLKGTRSFRPRALGRLGDLPVEEMTI